MKRNAEQREAGLRRWRGHPRWLLWLPILLMLQASTSPAEAALRIGTAVPQTTISGIDGTPVRVPESFRGKVAVLHFWQIGCSSCKLEMPAMDILYKQYRGKGIEILAVNVGQRKEDVKTFAAELGVSYPILIDPDEKGSRLFGVADVPRTYVIDRNGIVRYRIFGGATPALLKKLILSLL